ncbi:MAG TPA: hypothetical protein PLJ65_14285, partial [Casimicrobium sp.]|nr:hypothetical protein [Casimicrobium sp.]
MTKLAASGIATAFALVMLGGSAISTLQAAPVEAASPTSFQTSAPVDPLRLGQCRAARPPVATRHRDPFAG